MIDKIVLVIGILAGLLFVGIPFWAMVSSDMSVSTQMIQERHKRNLPDLRRKLKIAQRIVSAVCVISLGAMAWATYTFVQAGLDDGPDKHMGAAFIAAGLGLSGFVVGLYNVLRWAVKRKAITRLLAGK